MSIVETYYLIDFENVHEDGLSGSEKLGKYDHVHLFSSKNAPKISIEKLTRFNSVDLSFHEIPVGNQSLDMHLVSYLGYLIGINANNKYKYVIISNDSDYDKIISFWKNKNKSLVIRQNKISNLSNTQNQAKQQLSVHPLSIQIFPKRKLSLIQIYNEPSAVPDIPLQPATKLHLLL